MESRRAGDVRQGRGAPDNRSKAPRASGRRAFSKLCDSRESGGAWGGLAASGAKRGARWQAAERGRRSGSEKGTAGMRVTGTGCKC